MKKIIAITSATAILLSASTVFASPESDFEAAMKNPITGANVKMTMGFNIDKLGDGLAEDIPTDFDKNMDLSMDMALSASEDGKVLKSKIHMTMQAEEEISQDSWLDMDLSDIANPVMTQITSMTDEEGKLRYMVTDMASYISADYYESLLDQNNMMGVELNGKTPVYADGKYTITLSDEDIYTLLEEAFSQYTSAASTGIIGGADGPTSIITVVPAIPTPEASNDIIGYNEDYAAEILPFSPADISKLKLFGEDAITISIGLTDDKQYIHDMDMTIKIDTNVYELINTMGEISGADKDEIQSSLEGLTKENSDFACTIKANMVYSDINTDIKIEFPELTEENTYKITAPAHTKLDVPFEFREIDGAEVPFIQLRGLCNAVGITDDNITWDNGKISINYSDDNTAVLTIGNTSVEDTFDGETGILELDYAPYIKDDFTYVDISFGDIIGQWISVEYDADNNAAVMLID